MIIKLTESEGLADLSRKVAQLPANKRKVLILVGRHLNEGTHEIAKIHHKEWEAEGATTIEIPRKWTPQGIFGKAKKRIKVRQELKVVKKHVSSAEYFDEKLRDVPSDIDIAEKLMHLKIPIINFHSSPHDYENSTLDVYTSSESKLPHLEHEWEYTTLPSNQVLVEYYPPSKLFSEKNFERIQRQARLTSIEKSSLHPLYLMLGKIKKPAISHFSSHHASEFKEIIKKLATGFKPK